MNIVLGIRFITVPSVRHEERSLHVFNLNVVINIRKIYNIISVLLYLETCLFISEAFWEL